MSIIITITTYDGIVMAADSRMTYEDENENVNKYVDDSRNLFLTYEKVGIGFT